MSDEVIQELSEPPDMGDVALVIVNVETRDGRQYSFMVGLEDEAQHIGVQLKVDESDREEIRGDSGLIREVPARQLTTLTIYRRG